MPHEIASDLFYVRKWLFVMDGNHGATNDGFQKFFLQMVKKIISGNAGVNGHQKKKAYDLGKRILMICNASKFISFKETEATPSVIRDYDFGKTLESVFEIPGELRQFYRYQIFGNV